VFAIQLALNALWSWLFFAWQLGALAFIGVAALWVLILMTLVMFWRLKPLAGVLLAPYLAWVSLACALTWSVWQLNPQILG
ncbi:MAG: TspO/MBR family protein, partial [Halomonas sp.]